MRGAVLPFEGERRLPTAKSQNSDSKSNARPPAFCILRQFWHSPHHYGWLAEWLKAAVLKTDVAQATVGSNPTSPAIISLRVRSRQTIIAPQPPAERRRRDQGVFPRKLDVVKKPDSLKTVWFLVARFLRLAHKLIRGRGLQAVALCQTRYGLPPNSSGSCQRVCHGKLHRIL